MLCSCFVIKEGAKPNTYGEDWGRNNTTKKTREGQDQNIDNGRQGKTKEDRGRQWKTREDKGRQGKTRYAHPSPLSLMASYVAALWYHA